MNKKVLMTASSLAHISNFHLPYIKAFSDMSWEVHVAGSGPEREIPSASKVHVLKFEKSFGSPGNFRTASRLRDIIRENNYELIICHTSLAAFFTRLATVGIKGRSRLINVVHGYLFDERTSFVKACILKTAEYLMAPQTDLILTMNEWDNAWAKRHKIAKEVRYIPGMGISERKQLSGETETMPEFTDDDFVLVYPAEFSSRKNQAMLIRAMAMLPEAVKLVLPGTGALFEECRALAESLGLEDRVLFPGYVKNIFALLKSADVAVSSSRSEGLPFNIMEAMLSALPVIASRVKGHTDLIEDGVNGYLYEYDNEQAFAQAVEKLMLDRGLASNMGCIGREKVRQFELENVLHKVMHEYLH